MIELVANIELNRSGLLPGPILFPTNIYSITGVKYNHHHNALYFSIIYYSQHISNICLHTVEQVDSVIDYQAVRKTA